MLIVSGDVTPMSSLLAAAAAAAGAAGWFHGLNASLHDDRAACRSLAAVLVLLVLTCDASGCHTSVILRRDACS